MYYGRMRFKSWCAKCVGYDSLGVKGLTALLARTFIFGRGMKPVRSASATTPIGKTECGSKPKTETFHKLRFY